MEQAVLLQRSVVKHCVQESTMFLFARHIFTAYLLETSHPSSLSTRNVAAACRN
jgi:hypothetical protein